MDLSTTYLGLELPHPLMPGASPMVDDLDVVRRLEDAGMAALVMRSLFEEQLAVEQLAGASHKDAHEESYGEAQSYLPPGSSFALGPDEYLEQLYRVKRTVRVPLIASLNGATRGGWLEFARLMEQAGADAVELNVYQLVTDLDEDAAAVERNLVEMVRDVRSKLKIPVAVKLSPFFSSLPHLTRELSSAGADGLVLFNRFYQPDIDVEELEVNRTLHLSDSHELLLRLRWLAILYGRTPVDLAVSGGVHSGIDAIKSIMCGASGVQIVSALLQHGPERLTRILEEMRAWLEENEYDSLAAMRGNMSLERCPDPAAYERANYMQILQGWSA